jgi:hypothetical protein
MLVLAPGQICGAPGEFHRPHQPASDTPLPSRTALMVPRTYSKKFPHYLPKNMSAAATEG